MEFYIEGAMISLKHRTGATISASGSYLNRQRFYGHRARDDHDDDAGIFALDVATCE